MFLNLTTLLKVFKSPGQLHSLWWCSHSVVYSFSSWLLQLSQGSMEMTNFQLLCLPQLSKCKNRSLILPQAFPLQSSVIWIMSMPEPFSLPVDRPVCLPPTAEPLILWSYLLPNYVECDDTQSISINFHTCTSAGVPHQYTDNDLVVLNNPVMKACDNHTTIVWHACYWYLLPLKCWGGPHTLPRLWNSRKDL